MRTCNSNEANVSHMFKLRVSGASLGRRAIGQMNQQLTVGKAGPLDILVKGVGCQAPEAVQFGRRVVFKAATDGRAIGEPVDDPLAWLEVTPSPRCLGLAVVRENDALS